MTFRSAATAAETRLSLLCQVRFQFPNKAAALAYAKQYGLACEVSEPHRRSVTPKPYAENFPAVLEAAVWPELLLAA